MLVAVVSEPPGNRIGVTVPSADRSFSVAPGNPLGYADKAHPRSDSPAVEVVTGDCASIVDAGHVRKFALRRIEGGDGPIRVAYKTVEVPGGVKVGASDVASLVDTDPMRRGNE
jgi:hypothetical protein